MRHTFYPFPISHPNLSWLSLLTITCGLTSGLIMINTPCNGLPFDSHGSILARAQCHLSPAIKASSLQPRTSDQPRRPAPPPPLPRAAPRAAPLPPACAGAAPASRPTTRTCAAPSPAPSSPRRARLRAVRRAAWPPGARPLLEPGAAARHQPPAGSASRGCASAPTWLGSTRTSRALT